MMRAVVPSLEKHHTVHILDSGMEAAVRLSHRYLADRQLPDKAVSVLDTACARLALGQSATPGPIEDCQRILDDLALQDRVLTREQVAGADHRERLAAIAARRTQVEAQLAELEGRWLKEKDLVAKILDIRA
jgi:type VI secretion system protein VasG